MSAMALPTRIGMTKRYCDLSATGRTQSFEITLQLCQSPERCATQVVRSCRAELRFEKLRLPNDLGSRPRTVDVHENASHKDADFVDEQVFGRGRRHAVLLFFLRTGDVRAIAKGHAAGMPHRPADHYRSRINGAAPQDETGRASRPSSEDGSSEGGSRNEGLH